MKMHIKEFAKLTGVSVRTLHYYDEIGLLKPAFVDPNNNYRFYDEKNLERMQEILFYRELDFSLKSIIEILSSPNYNKEQALESQKYLLILKKQRLERLISAIDSALKGENTMNTEVFDNSEFECARKKYADEARERWSNTVAYKESQQKTANYSESKYRELDKEMSRIFSLFAKCKADGMKATDNGVQELAGELQKFITDNYYNCTSEIFAGLGKMYSKDERFRENIDKHGAGTAEFISSAIEVYCK